MNTHPESPATCHLDTGFRGFPLSLKNAEMVTNFQAPTARFSCGSIAVRVTKIIFEIYTV
jgi:hypothetical protein